MIILLKKAYGNHKSFVFSLEYFLFPFIYIIGLGEVGVGTIKYNLRLQKYIPESEKQISGVIFSHLHLRRLNMSRQPGGTHMSEVYG